MNGVTWTNTAGGDLYDAWHSALDVDVHADAAWQRMLLPYVTERVPGAEVLEIGCGRGGYAFRIWQAGPRRLVCSDFSGVAVRTTSEFLAGHGAAAVETRVEDVTRLSFADESFDVVICCETIEHVTDPRAAVCEMARVLRGSGSLLLSTPNYLSLHGLYRAYLRARRRRYTEEGQPINHLVMAPKTAWWLQRAGLQVEHRLGDGLYLPIPRAEGPLPIPLRPRLRRALRGVLLHSAFVARKRDP